MTPAAPGERIEALDVLRGFAVLGILAVNAAAFAMPSAWSIIPSLRPPDGPADLAAWAAVQVLFEAKFYSLFSMLFGVSVFLVGGDGGDSGRRGAAPPSAVLAGRVRPRPWGADLARRHPADLCARRGAGDVGARLAGPAAAAGRRRRLHPNPRPRPRRASRGRALSARSSLSGSPGRPPTWPKSAATEAGSRTR
jgi:hypothetical protein